MCKLLSHWCEHRCHSAVSWCRCHTSVHCNRGFIKTRRLPVIYCRLFWLWHRAIVDLKTEKFQLILVLDYAISCLIHNIHIEAAYFSFQNTFFYRFRMINPFKLIFVLTQVKVSIETHDTKQAADTHFAAAFVLNSSTWRRKWLRVQRDVKVWQVLDSMWMCLIHSRGHGHKKYWYHRPSARNNVFVTCKLLLLAGDNYLLTVLRSKYLYS